MLRRMAQDAVAAPSPVRSKQSRERVDGAERAILQQELAALARGERAAFDPLFARLWPLLRGFAAKCLPPQEAEDAAQEALLRIFFRASEFDSRRDGLSWVFGVAAWQIRTYRTRTRRRGEHSLAALADRKDDAPSPETDAMARESAEALDRALSELAPADAAT